MDPLTGALAAVAIGWSTILAAIALPVDRWVDPARLRVVGALTLGLLGASALGARVPPALTLGVLVGGLALAAWSARAARRQDQS